MHVGSLDWPGEGDIVGSHFCSLTAPPGLWGDGGERRTTPVWGVPPRPPHSGLLGRLLGSRCKRRLHGDGTLGTCLEEATSTNPATL